MDLGLTNKKALITGSTKGIGRAIAETLLEEGAAVAICARNADDVETAVSELQAKGHVYGTAVDAEDLKSLEAWISAASTALGGIDIYIHNTSAKPQKQLEDWNKNFNIYIMAIRYHRKRRQLSEINVVPYIDVMLVLLVIFMVPAP